MGAALALGAPGGRGAATSCRDNSPAWMWEWRQLGDVATFVIGRGLSKVDLSRNGMRPCIHYGELFKNYGERITDVLHGTDLQSNFVCSARNDVLMPTSDVTPNGLATASCIQRAGVILGGGILAIRVPENVLDGVFLAYSIGYHRNQVMQLVTGTTVYHLYGRDMAKFRFPVPTLEEQRAIADTLSDVDGLLESLEALIAKKRAVKTAAMQQLLTGKTRLPGFSGEWETKRIGDFTDCTAGGTPSTLISEYWGGTIRWMNSGELNDKLIHDVEGRITELGLRESSAKLVPPRCVLVGLAGQGKTRGTAALNSVKLCTNQSIAAIFPNQNFISEYLYQNLTFRYEELRRISEGHGGRGGLNLYIIRLIDVPFPAIDEQRAVATVLSDIDAEIVALERRLEKVRALKQSMMQQLLTGRIRLPASDTPANGQARSVERCPAVPGR